MRIQPKSYNESIHKDNSNMSPKQHYSVGHNYILYFSKDKHERHESIGQWGSRALKRNEKNLYCPKNTLVGFISALNSLLRTANKLTCVIDLQPPLFLRGSVKLPTCIFCTLQISPSSTVQQ